MEPESLLMSVIQMASEIGRYSDEVSIICGYEKRDDNTYIWTTHVLVCLMLFTRIDAVTVFLMNDNV